MSSHKSTWNTVAPLIAGILIVLIVFAWVFNRMRKDEARQVEEAARQAKIAAIEKAKAEEEEKERKKKEDDERRRKLLEDEKNRYQNWVRQKGTIVAQSATREPMSAILAADGNKKGSVAEKTVSFALPTLDREKKAKEPAWWRIDLGRNRTISEILLYNCSDADTKKRLSNFRITILDAKKNNVYEKNFYTAPGEFAPPVVKIPLDEEIEGRWVRIKLNGPNAMGDGALTLAEVEIIGPKDE